MNANEWLQAFADEIGTTPPSPDEFKALLDLAAEAAHASERIAAPAATWIAAKANADLEQAIEAAREISADA